MDKPEQKTLDMPDDRRKLAGMVLDIATVGPVTFTRAAALPGWRWSTDVKPQAGTDSCEVPHTLYQVSGTMKVRMDDGTEMTIRPGDIANIPPGHDAWVDGEEPAVSINVTPQMAEAFGKL